MTEAARKWNIDAVVIGLSRSEDLPNVFDAIQKASPQALLVAVEPLIGAHETDIIGFAATSRLPTLYDNGSTVRRGGLIAYSTMYLEHYAIAAKYVDKILRGAKPADLPVEQPSRFELVVNLRAAKAVGITFPAVVLLRADEIIQ